MRAHRIMRRTDALSASCYGDISESVNSSDQTPPCAEGEVGGRESVDGSVMVGKGSAATEAGVHTSYYRADWEPEATSGKCMAGVPGVFWRFPVVFWGLSTHNPALVPGKTHTSKNWPIFPLCTWKWGESAACGQARLWRPNGPQCAKTHAVWQSPLSRTEKLRTFSKKYFFIFRRFFGPTGVTFAVFALLAIFCGWHTF